MFCCVARICLPIVVERKKTNTSAPSRTATPMVTRLCGEMTAGPDDDRRRRREQRRKRVDVGTEGQSRRPLERERETDRDHRQRDVMLVDERAEAYALYQRAEEAAGDDGDDQRHR